MTLNSFYFYDNNHKHERVKTLLLSFVKNKIKMANYLH